MSQQRQNTSPLLYSSPSLPSVAAESSPFKQRKFSIVIAEDNELLREILAFELHRQGYDVYCAEDGESAWQLLSAHPVDLLITDNQMPKLSGLDLLRRMRAESLHQPVILMSGDMPRITPEIEELLNPGIAIAKPFALMDLLPRIAALLCLQINARALGHSYSDRMSESVFSG
jgi:DNA-binding response OmpR family regulator